MIRLGCLLLVFASAAARADIGAFDPRVVTSVYVEALTFMAPRTLDAVPVSQMAL